MYDMTEHSDDDYDDSECNAVDCYRVPITYKFNNWYCKSHLYRQGHIRYKIKLHAGLGDLRKEIKWREKEQHFRKDFDNHHVSYITVLKSMNVISKPCTSIIPTSFSADVSV